MKTRNILAKLLVLVVIVSFMSGTYAYAKKVPGVSQDKIKLGHFGDLTGPAAFIGTLLIDVAGAFFEHLNDQNGIHGRRIEFIAEDNKYSPVRTVAAFKYLISRHNVFAIHNVYGSTPCSAIFPLIKKEKIPVFPTFATATTMYTPPKRYLFSMTSVASDEAEIVVDYIMRDLKVKNPRIAICYQDDEWGKDGLKGMQEAVSKYGMKLATAESYKRGSVDLSSQTVNFKMAKAQYIFYIGFAPNFATLMKECKKLGMNISFFGDVATVTPQTLKLAGEAGRDSMYVIHSAMPQEDVPGMNDMKAILKKYRPDIKRIDPLMTVAWAGSTALIEAMKRTGRDLTREGLIGALESLKNFETGGLIPPITYGPINLGPKSRKGIHALRVLKADIDKLIFIPITEWRETSM
ncbi:MAG: ABC transporter substrate-binding protein [Thermodesulfobacteriota bacterium]|nr:ABC transporter substrate-binding protein [Thermodesulfobacteriota bacterium]